MIKSIYSKESRNIDLPIHLKKLFPSLFQIASHTFSYRLQFMNGKNKRKKIFPSRKNTNSCSSKNNNKIYCFKVKEVKQKK